MITNTTNFGGMSLNQLQCNILQASINNSIVSGSGDIEIKIHNAIIGGGFLSTKITYHYDNTNPTFTFESPTLIKNIADPVDNQDAATKAYVIANAGGSNDHTITDTVDDDISTAVTLKHDLSSGTPTPGIGTGINFITETLTGDEIGMSLTSVTTNVGSGTEDFDFVLNLMKNGATATEALRVTSDKILTIPTDGDIFLPDSVELRIGNTAADPNATIKHDGTELLVFNETGSTGHMILWNKANSGANRDILMRLNDDAGSSGLHIQNSSGNNILTVASDSETTCKKRTTVNNGHATPLFIYGKYTGGGSPASGMGTSIKFSTDLTDTDNHNIGTIIFQTEEDTAPTTPGDTTNAKLNTKILLHNYKGGTVQRVLKINNDGEFEIGNNTGDATLNTQFGDLILSTEDTAACKIERDGSKTYIASETGALELITKTGTTDRASIFMEDGTTGDISIDAGDDSTSQTSKIYLKGTDHTILQHRNHTAILNTTYKAADFEVVNLNGTGAVGGGVYVDFSVELSGSSGWPREIGKIEYVLQTNATQASRDSLLNLYNYKSGSEKRVLQIDKDGIFEVGNDDTSCTIKSQTTDLNLSTASNKVCQIKDSDGSLQIDGPQVHKKQTISNITNSSNQIYTSSEILSGLILRDCVGEDRTDSALNGTDLISAFTSNAGSTFDLLICNISDKGEALTISDSESNITVVGENVIRTGENIKFTGIINIGGTSYTMYSHGKRAKQIVNIDSSDPYIHEITGNNHTWTPAELMYGIVRRTTAGGSEDILPNPNLLIAAYPSLRLGDHVELVIIKTNASNCHFNASANGDFVCRGTSGGNPNSFDFSAGRNATANANRTSVFNIVIYEIGATPKAEFMIVARR